MMQLEKNSNAALTDNAKKNRELLEQLEKENNRLNELRQQLDARSRRVDELEHLIASKDAAMKNLKDALSKALLDFEGKGLTIEQRDGKVYVSMENKLLFNSGSWAVGVEGRKAVQQLGQVLSQNPDIMFLLKVIQMMYLISLQVQLMIIGIYLRRGQLLLFKF